MNSTIDIIEPQLIRKIEEQVIDAKVAFVSNTFGTTLNEVLLALVLPLLSCSNYFLLFHSYHADTWLKRIFSFINDQVFFVVPLLLGLTIFSNHLLLIDVGLFLSLVTILLWKIQFKLLDFVKGLIRCPGDDDTGYITNYKAIVQITTCICILAVDFDIFPRRFAKAEVYGIGCMDLGVGTFILSMGLTSPPARGKKRIVFRYVVKTISSSLMLILLGCARVLLVKVSNYQQHVTEYGVHWNFFFTLSMVRIAGIFILYLLPWCRNQLGYLLISLLVIVSYQYALSKAGLEVVIQEGFDGNDARTTFLDANREGIFSCIGYLSLYFFGMFFGSQLFKLHLTPFNKMCWLSLWGVAAWLCVNASVVYITPISRQMANVSYFVVQVFATSLVIGILLCCQTILKTLEVLNKKDDQTTDQQLNTTSGLSEAITQNQLLYFLMANVLTGLVNKSVDTINTDSTTSSCIIGLYMLLLNLAISFYTYVF